MSNRDYRIEPPPKDNGVEPLFRVVYAVDVGAADERKAAETAWQMMSSKDAFAPILMVIDNEGARTKLDLSEILEFNKVTVGFVIQKYRKDNKGTYRCICQEFNAGDDVQFENVKGESIEAPEHEYQPFNMLLFSGHQIIGRLREVLNSINVGGEQSRQFAGEIQILDKLLKDLGR